LKEKNFNHTFTSMSPILLAARIIGRPTKDGKICAGKFDPAYPTLTNYPRLTKMSCYGRQNIVSKYFIRKNNSPLFHYHKLILFFLDYPFHDFLLSWFYIGNLNYWTIRHKIWQRPKTKNYFPSEPTISAHGEVGSYHDNRLLNIIG
jgi:hypothetical protein